MTSVLFLLEKFQIALFIMKGILVVRLHVGFAEMVLFPLMIGIVVSSHQIVNESMTANIITLVMFRINIVMLAEMDLLGLFPTSVLKASTSVS